MVRPTRNAGTVGLLPGGVLGRTAGPLGIGPGVFAAPNQAGPNAGGPNPITQPTKVTLAMPRPAPRPSDVRAHDFPKWELFNKKAGNRVITLDDVEQNHLGNCALVAILGALAYTDVGRALIPGMITETPQAVETDLTGFVAGIDLSDKDATPQPNIITTPRLFRVKIAGQPKDVSDVLYTDDSNRGWKLVYMMSPTQCLWPCLIEKAYAVIHNNSYAELDGLTSKSAPSANQIWKDVVGKDADVYPISDKTPEQNIINTAKKAHTDPAIAASKDTIPNEKNPAMVVPKHGHVFLDWDAANKSVVLWDAMMQQKRVVTIPQFRIAFDAVLQWK